MGVRSNGKLLIAYRDERRLACPHPRCWPHAKVLYWGLLLDLKDASKVLARLHEPLIAPNEGDVPIVVYSCSAIIHQNHVVIPYAMSD
jgi:beta-1,4-mannooligosaccharide phosphorylase